MGSHSVTCHSAEEWIPPLSPAEADTRFSDPEGMRGWVDLCYVKTDRLGFETVTFQSQVQRPTIVQQYQNSSVIVNSFHFSFFPLFSRSTPPSPPNKVGLKCPLVRPSVRPSTKSFFDFNEIWYVRRGRWVMHDGMQYDPIQGQGQGHEPVKVGNSAIFKGYLLPYL